MADAALAYAARGLHVLPVWWVEDGRCACPNRTRCSEKPGKHPLGELVPNGLKNATTEPATIRAWWKRFPLANIGIALKPSGLIAFDVDKPENYEALAAIERELGGLPRTPAQRSGSGNKHFIWRAPDCEIRGQVRGITLRGANYIVGAPSIHLSGGRYQWEPGRSLDDIDPPEMPPGLLEMVRRPKATAPAKVRTTPLDNERQVKRARAWIAKADPAIEGQHGEGTLMRVCCKLVHGFRLSDADALSVILSDYNPRCVPPWGDDEIGEIERKIDEARNKCTNPELFAVEEREPPRTAHHEDEPAPRYSGEGEPGQPEPYKPVSVLAVDAANADTPPIRSYSTGNLQLDHLTGGINTRELAVVMGPPGGCKTAWAISTSIELARRAPVLYASTELEQHELMARFAANILRRSWGGIRRGAIARSTVADALNGLDVRLLGCELLPRDGDAALKLIEIEARWMAERYKQPPVIFIDYLQDLARGAERELRARVGDLASISRAMSQSLDCPVVAISSVARTFYSMRKAQEFREADDPTVYLAAAKESGDVDYAAARVLFLDAEDDREKPERSVRIAVAKSRDGQVGFAGARVIAECGHFMAAPEALAEMSAPGRSARDVTAKTDDADEKVYAAVVRMHAEGKRDLCTKSQLRTTCGIGAERVTPALERLVHVDRLRVAVIERVEGGKKKLRDIYEPTSATGGQS